MTGTVAGRLLLAAVAMAVFGPIGRAQAPAAAAFEAASVKLNTSGDPGAYLNWTGRTQVMLRNYPLKLMIQLAYDVKDYGFSGPPWLDTVRFDVVGKLPAGAPMAQFPAMLQTLLAERFKLAVHHESKVMPALALVVDKKGLKIKPVEPGRGGTWWGSTMVKASKISMTDFAGLLSKAMDRPVKNMTKVPGLYNFNIRWMGNDAPAMDTPGAESTVSTPMPTSAFAAVEELGLKLQTEKLAVDVLVVDHAERVPIEN